MSQAFELAFRKFQDAKESQHQFQVLKQKLEAASPEEKEKIKKEISALEAKKMAEEERLQRARDQIHSEAVARGAAPARVAPPPPSKATAPAPPVAKQPEEEKKEVPVRQNVI